MTSPAPLSGLSITNTSIKQPQIIWSGRIGEKPFIFNNDTVNTLYVGTKADVSRQDQSSCIPIPPLGGQSWPDVEIWAFAPVAVNMLIIPGATTWTPSPVQVQLALNAAGLMKDSTGQTGNTNTGNVHTDLALGTNNLLNGTSPGALIGTAGSTVAKDVSITGTPLLNLKQLLASGTNVNIPANSSVALSTAKGFNQPSYECFFSLNSAVNPAVPYEFQLSWLDSGTSTVIFTETYWVYPGAGAGANSHYFVGRGPTKADQLSISVTNTSGTTAGTISYLIFQNSRTYTGDLWRTITNNVGPPSFNGFTYANNAIDSGILCGITSPVPLNTTQTSLLPLYTGMVDLKGFTASTTSGDGAWQLTAASIGSSIGLGDKTFHEGRNGVSGFAPTPNLYYAENIAMPNAQCTVNQINRTTTTTETMTCDIIAKTLVVT